MHTEFARRTPLDKNANQRQHKVNAISVSEGERRTTKRSTHSVDSSSSTQAVAASMGGLGVGAASRRNASRSFSAGSVGGVAARAKPRRSVPGPAFGHREALNASDHLRRRHRAGRGPCQREAAERRRGRATASRSRRWSRQGPGTGRCPRHRRVCGHNAVGCALLLHRFR